MCILNGRITPHFNNYTCISTKGRSVVDYFLTSHMSIKFCKQFSVHKVDDLIAKFNLQGLISNRCKPPDHSVLKLTLSYSISETDHFLNRNPESDANVDTKRLCTMVQLGCILP